MSANNMLLKLKQCPKCYGKVVVEGFQGYNLHLRCKSCGALHIVHAGDVESEVYPSRRDREED